MALIKHVVNNAVHWRLPGNNPTNAANEMLRHINLPVNLINLFAPLRVNGANYEWSHPLTGWAPLNQADDFQRQTIIDMVSKARQEIVLKGHGLGENLIKLPNDEDYIFFRTGDNGEIEILFTGWGFENSRISTPAPPVLDPGKMPHKVRVGFTIDGTLVPGRPFTLSAGSLVNRQATTAPDGYFNIGSLKVGTMIGIIDGPSGKRFDIEVLPKQEDYINDVTQYATAEINLMRDGIPVSSPETVTINYHGEMKTLQYANGMPVSETFVLWDGEDIVVQAMGLTESRPLNAGINDITINVQTPPATVRVRMQHGDGSPFVSERLDVYYNGNVATLHTDSNGEARLTSPYAQGQTCRVVTSLGEQEKPLRAASEVLFEFKEIVEAPLETSVRVRVLHEDDSPFISEPVNIHYNGDNFNLVTDANGECFTKLNYSQGRLCTVKTAIGADQRVLNVDTEEVITIREVVNKPQEKFDYNIRFVDSEDMPERGVRVVFSQNGGQLPVTLDENGQTILPNGAFVVGQDIDVVMHHPDKKVTDIKFRLEPDEYEYVIKTVPETSSSSILWLVAFLFLLGLITIAACALTDWACAILYPLVAPLFH